MPGWLIWILSASATGLFIIDFCNLIYRCGCRSWWAGAAAACNVHQHAGHRCPFCAYGLEPFLALALLIVSVQAWLSFRGGPWPAKLLLALAAFPVIGTLEAIALGLFSGYWR